MSEQEIKLIQDKIDKGLEWSYEKMLSEKASRNENMVISRNNKIEVVSAREIMNEKN
ncbi:MAG: hypothetical protein J1F16_08030 [Muribaculaceae bacterium]|nr:hypothetical protein [Muribaculaceae bacterium]